MILPVGFCTNGISVAELHAGMFVSNVQRHASAKVWMYSRGSARKNIGNQILAVRASIGRGVTRCPSASTSTWWLRAGAGCTSAHTRTTRAQTRKQTHIHTHTYTFYKFLLAQAARQPASLAARHTYTTCLPASAHVCMRWHATCHANVPPEGLLRALGDESESSVFQANR